MAKMLQRLQEKTKKSGLFTPTQTSVAYSTGFLPLDYRNGVIVQSIDDDENVIMTRPSVGLVGGTFITIVGKSGTAKTTLACQMAANIVKPFPESFVQIYDLEQSLTYTRLKNITGLKQVELREKVILRQEKNYIEDIYNAIETIAREKEENRAEYSYDTGLLDEFGKKITAFQPNVVIIDSIPTLASKDMEKKDEMEGSTYANRVAKALSQFYKRLMPIIKTYNITVIAINHINQKIEINPMMKSAPQLAFMKMDESLPRRRPLGCYEVIYN